RLRVDSFSPLGPTAPLSPPPWPGSSTTVTPWSGRPAATVTVFEHGVSTSQPAGVRPSTGTTTPRAVTSAATGVGTAVVVVGPRGGMVASVVDEARDADVVDVAGRRGRDAARPPWPHATGRSRSAAVAAVRRTALRGRRRPRP